MKFGASCILISVLSFGAPLSVDAAQSWLENARISSPYDDPSGASDWEDGVRAAVANGATVILDWSLVSDNWKPLFEPEQSVAIDELRTRATWIHQNFPNLRYIVYVGPLEYVTSDLDSDGDGQIDAGREDDSLSLQHPEWAQIGLDGRPAVFFGFEPGMPFWVCPSCEDVWVSPANTELRQAVTGLYRRVAGSGLDGLWIDVPFLMDEFGDHWQQQLPDLSPAARDLFSAQTGLSLGEPPLSPDWDSSDWQNFIEWRYRLIGDFIGEIQTAVRAVRPDFEIIVESSVSWNNRMTAFGASPVEMPEVVSTTAHELGGTENPVSVFSWEFFLGQLEAWRHMDLASGEPSWLLGYVEAGHDYSYDLGRVHAAASALSGFSLHVSGAEDMTTMHDRVFLRKLNEWLDGMSPDLWRGTTRPMAQTAVVFSRSTMDFDSRASWETDDYGPGFLGTLMILQEHHVPYEVLSATALDRLSFFQAAILPEGECLSDSEAEQLRQWVAAGGRLLSTGSPSSRDEFGNSRADYALADVFGVHLADVEDEDERVFEKDFGQGHSVLAPAPHELYYFWEADPESDSPSNPIAAETESSSFYALFTRLGLDPILSTDAPSGVVLLPWVTANGKVLVSAINLTGLSASSAQPTPLEFDVSLHLPADMGRPALRWTEILEDSVSLSPLEETSDTITMHLQLHTGALLEILPGRLDGGDRPLLREQLYSD